jgi:CheY-like chemotaxis protein
VSHIVSDGIQALSAIAYQVFDLILMDLQMPGMSGYDVAYQIRCGNSPNLATPIVALTADAHSYVLEKIKSAGMNDVIHKPIKLQQLSSALKKWTKNYVAPDRMPYEQKISSPAPEPPGSDKEKLVIDFEQTVHEFGGNKSLFKEVLTAFTITLKKQIADMRELLMSENNIEQLRKEAHKIHGAAANLSAQLLAEKAAELEEYCSSKKPEKKHLASLLTALEQEYTRLAENAEKFK